MEKKRHARSPVTHGPCGVRRKTGPMSSARPLPSNPGPSNTSYMRNVLCPGVGGSWDVRATEGAELAWGWGEWWDPTCSTGERLPSRNRGAGRSEKGAKMVEPAVEHHGGALNNRCTCPGGYWLPGLEGPGSNVPLPGVLCWESLCCIHLSPPLTERRHHGSGWADGRHGPFITCNTPSELGLLSLFSKEKPQA